VDPDIRFARGLGDLMQRLVYTDDQLVLSVSNSLKLHDLERQSLMGKLLAMFAPLTGDPDIKIDGMRLQHLYKLAKSTPPVEIAISKTYAMEVKELRLLLEASIENLRRNTPPWKKSPG
jgi:hypothetical protein